MQGVARPAGFTLLEVMIAMLILLVGLLGVAGLVTTIGKTGDLSRDITVATTLAGSAMEEQAAAILDGDCPTVTTQEVEPYGAATLPPGFRRVTTWAPDSPAPGMVTVTIRVEFAAGRSSLEFMSLHRMPEEED